MFAGSRKRSLAGTRRSRAAKASVSRPRAPLRRPAGVTRARATTVVMTGAPTGYQAALPSPRLAPRPVQWRARAAGPRLAPLVCQACLPRQLGRLRAPRPGHRRARLRRVRFRRFLVSARPSRRAPAGLPPRRAPRRDRGRPRPDSPDSLDRRVRPDKPGSPARARHGPLRHGPLHRGQAARRAGKASTARQAPHARALRVRVPRARRPRASADRVPVPGQVTTRSARRRPAWAPPRHARPSAAIA